jgi:hypothetical protein
MPVAEPGTPVGEPLIVPGAPAGEPWTPVAAFGVVLAAAGALLAGCAWLGAVVPAGAATTGPGWFDEPQPAENNVRNTTPAQTMRQFMTTSAKTGRIRKDDGALSTMSGRMSSLFLDIFGQSTCCRPRLMYPNHRTIQRSSSSS